MPKTPHSSRGPSRSSGRGSASKGERPGRRGAWSTGTAEASNPTGGARASALAFRAPTPPWPGQRRAANTDPRNGITMAIESPVQIPRQRIQELVEREEAQLNEHTRASRATYERARVHLSGGVASSYQLRDPWPIYLERGVGPKVWDVDGNEMYDFHNGFGSMVQGHAHPAIQQAIVDRYASGTHFAAPTEDAIVVGDELARRWGLPKWRYTNSGSESTMDAIRIARGFTGRDTIVKIFGSYHGHHDGVMVSIGVEYDKIGHHENLASPPYGAGIPQALVDLTIPVPFNDAGAM